MESKGQLVVPYSLTNNDGKYMTGIATSDQWTCFTREGKTQPKMMSVGMHMRLIGHPARAVGLKQLLDYIQKHDGVWLTRRVDAARHIKTHPIKSRG